MGRVTGKYMGEGYGDKEGKTCPHPRHIAMPRPTIVLGPTGSENNNFSKHTSLATS